MRSHPKPARCGQVSLLALWFLVLGLPGAICRGEEPGNPAEWLPEDTIAYFHCAGWKDWSEKLRATSLAKIAQEPEMRNFLAGPWARLSSLIGLEPGAVAGAAAGPGYLAMASEYVPGPVLAAVTRGPADAAGKRPVGGVVLLGVKHPSGNQQAESMLSMLQMGLTALNAWRPETVRQEDRGANGKMIILKVGGMEPTLSLAKCREQGYLMAATHAPLCRDLVDGLSAPGGAAGPKLSANAVFKSCGAPVAAHQSAYINVAELRAAAGVQGGSPGRVREALVSAGLDNIRAVAWSLRLDGPGFETRTGIRLDGPRKGWLASLDTQPISAAALKICKPGCSFALGARVHPGRLLPMLEALLRQACGAEEAQRLAAVRQKLAAEGRDLAADLSAAFGNEVVVTSFRAKDGAPPGALVALTASLQVTNRAKADGLVTDLMKRMLAQRDANLKVEDCVRTPEFEGYKLLYLDLPAGARGMGPVFALSEDRLLVGLDVQTLKAAARGLKDPSLAGDAVFQAALQKAGGSLGSLFLYVDYAQIYTSAFSFGATALSLLNTIVPLREAGIDLAMLPAPEAVTRHLFPSLTVLEMGENSLTLTSRGPIPSPELLAPPIAALAATAAAFTGEMGK